MDEAQEQAMRTAFEQVHRLRDTMATADSDAAIQQARDAADTISAPWETGPDSRDWDWLNAVAEDWRVAPEAMRRQMDNLRHDQRVGASPYSPSQARSMHQAGTLVDRLYREQLQWRAQHVAAAAEQGRIDARLAAPGATDADRAALTDARSRVWDTPGGNPDTWSPERRAWEQAYRLDPANHEQERQAYFSAHAAEHHRLHGTQEPESGATREAAGRDGARIRHLLDAATAGREGQPSITPAATDAHQDPDVSAAAVLGHHEPHRGAAGHELG